MTMTQPLTISDTGPRLDAARFRRELAIRGATAGTLAHEAGVAPNTISRILTGQSISVATLRAVAKALHAMPVLPGLAELLVADTRNAAIVGTTAASMENSSGAADLQT